jgi:hypothetical protein
VGYDINGPPKLCNDSKKIRLVKNLIERAVDSIASMLGLHISQYIKRTIMNRRDIMYYKPSNGVKSDTWKRIAKRPGSMIL